MPLHLTKIAFGAKSFADIESWFAGRKFLAVNTRYRPTRHEELVGGSLYWVFEHALVARNEIIGFREKEDGRWWIDLAPQLIRTHPLPRRAHQGWRYLKDENTARDLAEGELAGDVMPTKMARELSKLGLV